MMKVEENMETAMRESVVNVGIVTYAVILKENS